MKSIEHIYTPYNFSATRCHVFVLTIAKGTFHKIEFKIPAYIKNLKGIYVSSSSINLTNKISGYISLNFNGQSFKSYHCPVFKSKTLNDYSHPLPLNEKIRPNSFMQGYFLSYSLSEEEEEPFTISIYLHYKP